MALDVDAVAIRQRRWWRQTVHGADPLAQRLPAPDGRWQRGAIVEALYFASDEATVWAEWYRHLAEAGIPPNQQMPRDLWTWALTQPAPVAHHRGGGGLVRWPPGGTTKKGLYVTYAPSAHHTGRQGPPRPPPWRIRALT